MSQEEVKETEGTDTQEHLPQSQSELDSVISKAIGTALKNNTAKLEEQFNQKLKEELEKERSYAKLSEKEKEEAKLTEREEELKERERALALAELKAEVKTDVLEKGLPTELVDFLVVLDDKEKILDAVNAVQKVIENKVRDEVKEKVRQDTPSEPQRTYNAPNDRQTLAERAAKHRII